ncbi:hypothetical protein K474DRAFT_1291804 [Panus rudis PR-1116 ss-1]|nr:hypothetical protein K474DRAFT_1291804 [Panus rudis PR-1116 ss-1]
MSAEVKHHQGSSQSREIVEAQIDQHELAILDIKKKCEEAVAAELTQIALKRRSLNELLPVVQLLPEILLHIFKYCVYAFEKSPSRPYGWVRPVTHVCHRWRKLALDSPSLWTHIVVTRPSWGRILVERSQQAYLIVLANQNVPVDGFLGELITKDIHRIQSLQLTLDRSQWLALGAKLPTCQPAKALQRVRLTNIGTQRQNQPLELPLFIAERPEIQSLKVSGPWVLSWNNPPFSPNLHELSITLPNRGNQFTIDSVLTVLEGLSQLRVLHLAFESSRMVLDQNDASFAATKAIHLPRLSLLSIKDVAHSCATFLRQISFPPTSHISVHVDGFNDTDDLRGLTTSLSHHMQGMGPMRTMRTGAIGNADDYYLELYSVPAAIEDIFSFPNLGDPKIKLVICRLYSSDIVFNAAFNELLAPEVSSVLLEGFRAKGELTPHIITLFSEMPKVESLRVRGGALKYIAGLLAYGMPHFFQVESSCSDATHTILLQQLRELMIDPIDFALTSLRSDKLDMLCDALQQRKDINGPIFTRFLLRQPQRFNKEGYLKIVGALEDMCGQPNKFTKVLVPDETSARPKRVREAIGSWAGDAWKSTTVFAFK